MNSKITKKYYRCFSKVR